VFRLLSELHFAFIGSGNAAMDFLRWLQIQ
jgi:hypothetical protein